MLPRLWFLASTGGTMAPANVMVLYANGKDIHSSWRRQVSKVSVTKRNYGNYQHTVSRIYLQKPFDHDDARRLSVPGDEHRRPCPRAAPAPARRSEDSAADLGTLRDSPGAFELFKICSSATVFAAAEQPGVGQRGEPVGDLGR